MTVVAKSVGAKVAADVPAAYTITAVPMANGSTIPAISLSAFISLRIFAKVANIFLTLQRCA